MAITKSAKKAHRVSLRKRVVNLRRTRDMRESVKAALSGKGSGKEALAAAYKAIDKAAKRGVIKKNTASRKKARIARALSDKKK